MNTAAQDSQGCGCSSVQVVEAPDVWDYSLLFSQLKAELQHEDAVTNNSGTGAHNAGETGVHSCLNALQHDGRLPLTG